MEERLDIQTKEVEILMGKYAKFLEPSTIKKLLQEQGQISVNNAKGLIDRSVDTKGIPFPSIKENRKPLFKTRSLYEAFGFRSSASKLEVFNSVSYFSFHNFGTKFIDKRQTLDEEKEGIRVADEINKELDSIK